MATPSEIALRHRRKLFLDSLLCMSGRQLTHTLSVEDSAELEALFQVALHEQWFEMAAVIRAETKRRLGEVEGTEMP